MKKIAVYPGTFDPITNGHLDLLVRAKHLFDHVIVAVSNNPKKDPMFSLDERMYLVNEVIKDMQNVTVEGFDELLVEFVRSKDAGFIIRGLRAVSDFEFEFQLAAANRRLNDSIETIFLTPSESNYFTSSSLVREISYYKGSIDSFVPKVVEEALFAKWDEQNLGK